MHIKNAAVKCLFQFWITYALCLLNVTTVFSNN